MGKHIPKVGDLVRIREFNDMKKEFGGVNDFGEIDLGDILFLPEMKKFFGKEFVISEVREDGVCIGHGINEYTITVGMLEPVAEEEYDTDEICDFLSSIPVA